MLISAFNAYQSDDMACLMLISVDKTWNRFISQRPLFRGRSVQLEFFVPAKSKTRRFRLNSLMCQVAFRHKIRWATEWYYSFLPKFNLCEDFHISPKTNSVCPVEFFVPAKSKTRRFRLNSLTYEFNVSPETLVWVSDPPVENVP